jgi:hypothetical protein
MQSLIHRRVNDRNRIPRRHCSMTKPHDGPYCSPKTPLSPLKISPTPIPSAPTLALTSRSLSSSLLLAVLNIRFATRSAVLRYCSILCTPSAKRSMCGSSDSLSLVRCDCKAAGVVKVNADWSGWCCDSWSAGRCGNWSAESMAACSGSRIELSISETRGSGMCVAGAGGGGLDDEDDAKASQAAFSSSSLSRC